jgi:hypothetical protein
VSPSINSDFQPLAPATNNQIKIAQKKKSVREGKNVFPHVLLRARGSHPEADVKRGDESASGELTNVVPLE